MAIRYLSGINVDSNTLFVDDANNRVGIGTNVPLGQLDVYTGTYNRFYTSYPDIYTSRFNLGVNAYIQQDSNSGELRLSQSYTSSFVRMTFYVAGSERMRIASDGNIGIGTTSPAKKLVIAGASSELQLYSDSDISTIDSRALGNTSSKWLAINPSGGSVGIGTTTPVSPLDVNGIISSRGIYIAQNSGTYNLIYNASNSVAMYLGGSADPGNYYDNTTHYFRSSGGGTTYATINSFGSVGIGTTSPADRLYVGNTAGTSISVSTNLAAGTNGSPLNLDLNFRGYADVKMAMIRSWDESASTGNGHLTFWTNEYTGVNVFTEKMRIGPTGSIKLNSYGSGSNTGTATQRLAVDASGNVIEIPIGSGPVDGNGTANYVTKWSDADTITNSIIYDNGTNVGIGTTSPESKLEVYNGNISLRLNTYASSARYGFGNPARTDDAAYIQYSGIGDFTGSLIFATNGTTSNVAATEKMRITGTGNVGIGTTSPAEKLHVSGRVRIGDYMKIASGSNYMGQIGFNRNVEDGTIYNTSYGAHQVQNYNGTLEFQVFNSSGIYVTQHNMFANGNVSLGGNVGIGTTSPETKIDVRGSARFGATSVSNGDIDLWSSSNGIHSGSSITWRMNTGGGNPNSAISRIQPDIYNPSRSYINALDFYVGDWNNNNNVGPALMSIMTTGNVGIGTTSPSSLLHLSNSVGPVITMDDASGRSTVFRNVSTSTAAAIGTVSNHTFQIITNNTSKIFITEAGNVGIGTTSPSSLLHVSGSSYFDGNMGINGEGSGVTVDTGYGNNGRVGFMKYGGLEGMLVAGSDTVLRLGHRTDSTVVAGGTATIRQDLVITAAGNVGIGTTSPAAKLDVVGSFRVGANGMSIDSNGIATTLSTNTPWSAFRNSHPQNIIPNGDLESWTSGTSTAPDGYGGYDLGASTIITRESSVVKQGTYSAKILNPSGAAFSGMSYSATRIDRTPGSTSTSQYTVSFWYLAPTSNGSSSYFGVISDVNPGYILIENLPKTNSWTFYSKTFSIRDDSTWDFLWWASWGAGTANDVLYIDSIVLSKGTQLYDITQSSVSRTGNVTRWGDFYNLGGNVGIGTAAQLARTTILSDSSAQTIGLIGRSADNIATIRWWNNAGNTIYTAIESNANYTIYNTVTNGYAAFFTNNSERLRITSAGNVGIGTTSPAGRLSVEGDGTEYSNIVFKQSAAQEHLIYASANSQYNLIGSGAPIWIWGQQGSTERMRLNNTGLGIGTDAPTQKLHVSGNVRVTGAYYDSNNEAGTSGQVLTSTGSGTDWVTPATTTASSLYDLLPAARTTYDWTVQMTSGTWADIFSSNTVLSNGTWMVQVYVSDFASGGQQYQETYSGVMSWGNASSTNEIGPEAMSEVVLHRSGHAANSGNFYLRTQERAGSTLLLQGMINYSHTSNTTINFKFVKVF